ncbi:MAG: type II secretion system F family protein [Nocardioides sp.]
MLLLFILGVALVFVALGLVGSALGGASDATGVTRSVELLEAMSGAPRELTKEIDRPFSDRVMAPFQARALMVGRRLSGADTADRIRHKLDLAGNPPGWTVDRVTSGKVIGAISMFFISLVLTGAMGTGFTLRIVLVLGGTLVGFFSPNLYLYQKSYDRAAQLQRGLPDAVDLLTISVESGLGFDAALQQVARNTDGPLAEEVSRVLREMQIGMGRSAALRGLADRTNVTDVRSFVSAMVQADAFGIPIAQVLRVQSHEMRTKRRQRAEEKAQQVPVKITVPLIFCILPTLFIAVMGPAAIHIMDSFAK